MTDPSRDLGEVTSDLYTQHLLYQNGRTQRQMLMLQWEQTNMMRRHQGLPELPPPAPPANVGVEAFRALWLLFKWSVYGFLIILAIFAVGSTLS